MSKITLNSIGSLTNENSAIVLLNDNSDTITNAMENTLSRDGTTPNTMEADLDMNSNRILNLPAAVEDTDPVRLIDVDDAIAEGISLVIAGAVQDELDTTVAAAVAAAAPAIIAGLAGATAATLGVVSNNRLAKTANYTVLNADNSRTIALGGNSCFTLIFAAASGYDTNFSVKVFNEDSGRGKIMVVNGLTTFILWPLQSVVIFKDNGAWKTDPQGPDRWFAPGISFFVHPSGSDTANDGLVAGSSNAFATIQHAVDVIKKYVDMQGAQATINLADGTHQVGSGVSIVYALTGSTEFTITGSASTACTVNCDAGGGCFIAREPATVTLIGMKLTTSGNSSTAINASQFATVDFSDIEFGAFNLGTHIIASDQASVNCLGNYAVSGGAVTHVNCSFNSYVNLDSFTVTITNTPTFTNWVTAIYGGNVNSGNTMTFVGSVASGCTKYFERWPGQIILGSTVYPGSVAGTTDKILKTDVLNTTFHGDSNYTILNTDRQIRPSANFTAARTWTLPAASTWPIGASLIINATGVITSTNTLSIAPAGGDLINQSSSAIVLDNVYDELKIWGDGSTWWCSPLDGRKNAMTSIGLATTTTATRIPKYSNTTGGQAQTTLAIDANNKLIVQATTTTAASINMPSGTAPSSPVDGDFWYDGTNLKFRVGGTTKTITIT